MKKLGLVAVGIALLSLAGVWIWRNWDKRAPEPIDPPAVAGEEDKKPDRKAPAEQEPASAQDPRDTEFVDSNRAVSRPSVNLLRLPQARLVRTTALRREAEGLAALTDDDPRTVAEATAGANAPLDVVYGFGGRTVTAEALFVRLPQPDQPGAATGRVEILVSTLSPNAGFRLVRSDPLAQSGVGQVFPFPPTGARWILLRFYSTGKALRVAIAEAAVVGRDGPPVSRYAFKESPARAIDALARLKKLTALNINPSKEEAELFADARAGKLDKWTFADAALLASGVARDDQRQKYRKRLALLEKEARKAVARGNPHQKGEKLLRWLHPQALGKGYVGKHTDLSLLLDQQTFNCVSSAVLYNVLARRLGLDARAVEVPDHVFSIVYNGTKHADVETTTPRGFKPARDAVEEFEKQTGFVYIPDTHRDKRREIRDLGLVAIIYHNRGVKFAHARRWHESLGQFFRALSLDPELHSAVKNTLTVLALWGWELAAAGKYDQALEVLGAGQELAPRDARLIHNRKAVWTQWGMALVGQGKDADALAVLRRAAAAVPDGHFPAMQAWIFIRKAEELAQAGKWGPALAALVPGFDKVDKPAAEELRYYRTGLRLRWAHAEIAAGRYTQALDVLDEGLAQDPADRRLARHLAFAVQEYAVQTHNEEGEARAREVLAAQEKRFAKVKAVQAVAAGYVWGFIKGLLDSGEYEKALAFLERSRDLLADPQVARYLALAVYDAWADSLAQKKEYGKAVDVCRAARDRYPKDQEVVKRCVARLDAWAKARAEEGAWDDALALYEKYRKDLLTEEQAKERLLYLAILWTRRTYVTEGPAKADELSTRLRKRFPAIPHLRRGTNRDALVELVRELSTAGKYEQALAVIDRAGKMLDDEDKGRKLYYTLLREVSAGLAARHGRQAVDLRKWQQQGPRGNGNWELADDGTTVRQMVNGAPTFFVAPEDSINTTVRGRLKVEDHSDDDYIGFVFGYRAPLGETPKGEVACDFFLFDWKAADQGLAREGYTLTRVRGQLPVADDENSPWWNHKSSPQFRVLATDYGKGKGWRPGVEYEFELVYRADRIRITLAGKTIFDLKDPAAANPPGRFGFYNYSQAGVRYSGFTRQAMPRASALLDLPDLEARLLQALTDLDGAVRAAAADILANLEMRSAIPSLTIRVADDRWVKSEYRNAELNDPVAGGKAAALAALRKLAPEQVTAALVQAAQSHTAAVAVWACDELASQKDRAALEALVQALANSDGYIRRAAADALKKRGDKAAVPALAKRIADEVWLPVPGGFVIYKDEPYDGFKGLGSKDHALDALRALDRDQATPALLAALGAKTARVRAWAADELGRQKGPAVVKALIPMLTDEDGYVRRAAADSLKKLGDKAAVPALVKRVADEVFFPRPKGFFTYRDEPYDGFKGLGSKDHALEALKTLAREKVNAALEQAAKSDNAQVKEWAERELIRFNGPTSANDKEDVKGTPPPKGALVLFGGKDLAGWVKRDGKTPAHWKVLRTGILQVEPGGDIMTSKKFTGRFKLHVEFRVPHLPHSRGQARGNSGVYVQGRYEVQILDSYGLKSKDDDCGAIYGVAAPWVNACKRPAVWQSYDIEFTAPKCVKGKKVEPARMTVHHNGVLIHDNVKIARDNTVGGLEDDPCTPGPILLQEYSGDPVEFRNIWLLPLPDRDG
jgi:HEAT repeat protein/tetratricopeptide (TPR) repeat protein